MLKAKVAVQILAGTALIGSFFLLSASSGAPTSASQSAATSSPDLTGRVEGHEAFDFDPLVGGVLVVSLLPLTADSDGHLVRAVSAVLMYQKATTYLGDANFHQLVPADSSRVINLSVQGLDLSMDSVAPDAPTELRSFRCTIVPRTGLTWGTVRVFAEDVVLESLPL